MGNKMENIRWISKMRWGRYDVMARETVGLSVGMRASSINEIEHG
jgi:hypothetical protein